MFATRPSSFVSVLLLTLTLFQSSSAISSRNDEDINRITSFDNNTSGLGNLQGKLDNNVNLHINKSTEGRNSGDELFQSSKLVNKEKSVTSKGKLSTVKDEPLLFTHSIHPRFINDSNSKNVTMTKDKKTTKIDSTSPVHLNKKNIKSLEESSAQFLDRSRRQSECKSSVQCDGQQCTTRKICTKRSTCINGQCSDDSQSSSSQTNPDNGFLGTWGLPLPENSWGTTNQWQSTNSWSDTDSQPSNPNTIPQTNTNPGTDTNTNTNPATFTNTNTNTFTNADTNNNANTNTQTGSVPSQSLNVGGTGGNGVIIINVNGGNGGSGGSVSTKPRQ